MSASPDSDPVEIELKFQLPDGSRAMLERDAALAETTAQCRHLVSTYFDTPDRALDRCGLTLRVRGDGSGRTQTVKSRSDGQGVADSRYEWEWPVEQNQPDLSLLEATAALTDAARSVEGRLEAVFVTDIQRTTRLLHLDDDTTVEVALDEGHVAAGDAREPISEMELELKGGAPGPLYALAARLQTLAPLWLNCDSKAARGWRLHAGTNQDTDEQAQRARVPDLKHKVRAAAAFRQLMNGTLGHLTGNIGLVLRGDAEALHQARVAIRETRALLQLFKPCLDGDTVARFNVDLRSIARVFGAARDWDVFCLQTLPAAVADLAPGSLDALKTAAEAERQAAYAEVGETLRSPDFTRLVLALAAWANGPDFESPTGRDDAMHQRLTDLAPQLLDRSAERVAHRGHHVARLSENKRHDLRKSLKKLAFDVRCLAHFGDDKGVKRYRRRVAKLARTLGGANDAAVTAELTDMLATAQPDLAQQAHVLQQWNTQRSDAALKGVKRAMDKFRKVPAFWS